MHMVSKLFRGPRSNARSVENPWLLNSSTTPLQCPAHLSSLVTFQFEVCDIWRTQFSLISLLLNCTFLGLAKMAVKPTSASRCREVADDTPGPLYIKMYLLIEKCICSSGSSSPRGAAMQLLGAAVLAALAAAEGAAPPAAVSENTQAAEPALLEEKAAEAAPVEEKAAEAAPVEDTVSEAATDEKKAAESDPVE